MPSEPMTPERIEQIKARVAKASGQTWRAWNMVHAETGKPMTPEELGEYVKNCVIKSIEDGGSADQFLFVSFDGEGNPDICHVGNGPNRAANAAFIAHARQDVPDLVAEVERLREALGDLLSWFPEKPSEPKWELTAGEYGADDAIAHARAALGAPNDQ